MNKCEHNSSAESFVGTLTFSDTYLASWQRFSARLSFLTVSFDMPNGVLARERMHGRMIDVANLSVRNKLEHCLSTV